MRRGDPARTRRGEHRWPAGAPALPQGLSAAAGWSPAAEAVVRSMVEPESATGTADAEPSCCLARYEK